MEQPRHQAGLNLSICAARRYITLSHGQKADLRRAKTPEPVASGGNPAASSKHGAPVSDQLAIAHDTEQ